LAASEEVLAEASVVVVMVVQMEDIVIDNPVEDHHIEDQLEDGHSEVHQVASIDGTQTRTSSPSLAFPYQQEMKTSL
jgi:hypothetical protein